MCHKFIPGPWWSCMSLGSSNALSLTLRQSMEPISSTCIINGVYHPKCILSMWTPGGIPGDSDKDLTTHIGDSGKDLTTHKGILPRMWLPIYGILTRFWLPIYGFWQGFDYPYMGFWQGFDYPYKKFWQEHFEATLFWQWHEWGCGWGLWQGHELAKGVWVGIVTGTWIGHGGVGGDDCDIHGAVGMDPDRHEYGWGFWQLLFSQPEIPWYAHGDIWGFTLTFA